MKSFLTIVLVMYGISSPCLANDGAKIKCSDLGWKFAAEFKKEYANSISLWGNPELHYSSTLGTCLAYTEFIDGALEKGVTGTWYYCRITDVYTNKVLAYSRFIISKKGQNKKATLVNHSNVGDAVNLLPEVFAARKAVLFNQ